VRDESFKQISVSEGRFCTDPHTQ